MGTERYGVLEEGCKALLWWQFRTAHLNTVHSHFTWNLAKLDLKEIRSSINDDPWNFRRSLRRRFDPC